MSFRTETDSLGPVQVPSDAFFGAQTQRAVENFPISGQRMPARFIRAIILIKRAAALANKELGQLDEKIAGAIVQTADEALAAIAKGGAEAEKWLSQFPVDVFQTGSATSTNMNANEVL